MTALHIMEAIVSGAADRLRHWLIEFDSPPLPEEA
jgi:hypothetical protein